MGPGGQGWEQVGALGGEYCTVFGGGVYVWWRGEVRV